MKKIFTIGHSTSTVEEFIRLLKLHDITCIADVRSVPYSQYASQFNKENLLLELKKEKINYVYLGEEFGARRDNPELYTNNQVDFEKVAKDVVFMTGIKRINDGINKGFNIALMCSEKDPITCHRCILVGHQLDKNSFNVEHILNDGTLKNQKQIDDELLDKFYPGRNQLSLFGNKADAELIEDAYRLQNKEVGYKRGE